MGEFKQKYDELFSNKETYDFRGPLSPLLCGVPWVKDQDFPVFFLAKGRNSFWSIDVNSYRSFSKKKFDDYCAGKHTIAELEREYHALASKIAALYEEETADVSRLKVLSDEDLASKIGFYGELLSALISETIYIETLDRVIVTEVLGHDVSDELWEKATHPAFLSFETRRAGMVIDAIEKQKSNSASYLSFIYTDYFSTKNGSEIISEIDKVRKDLATRRNEYEKQLARISVEKEKRSVWLERLDVQSRKVAEYLDMVMEMRDLRKDPIAQLQALMNLFSKEVIFRLGIPSELAYMVTPAEYGKGYNYLVSIKEEIQKRSNGVCGVLGVSTGAIVSSCDYYEMEKNFVVKTADESVKGQVAFRGKVRGKVVVVLDPQNHQGFEDGNILITGMTRPEFVSLMKKSAGVVTNEGGITCHAAIVSRELKIPCVIGTKIATQVFKTGDIVEVDAERGIVKKI